MPSIARKNDRIIGMDTHVVMMPTPGGQVPTPLPFTFSGTISDGVASSVKADDLPVAVVGSTAPNSPPHIAVGGSFQNAPKDEATVVVGSSTVFANDKQVARMGDAADSCDEIGATNNAHIVGGSATVVAG